MTRYSRRYALREAFLLLYAALVAAAAYWQSSGALMLFLKKILARMGF